MIASFVIGFHTARIGNLLQTLRFLNKNHENVVNDSHIELLCQNQLSEEEKKSINLLTDNFCTSNITDLNLNQMMLPRLTNLGVKNCNTEKIIVIESDRILPSGYFQSVIDELKQGVQITCLNMKKLTKEVSDLEINNNNFEYKKEIRDKNNAIGSRNMWSGNTAFFKSDYYKAGLMDESYIGYGWADSDMTNAMNSIGVKSIYKEDEEIHLWHPPSTYGSGDQKQLFINNGLKFCKKWGQSLPNWFRTEIQQNTRLII